MYISYSEYNVYTFVFEFSNKTLLLNAHFIFRIQFVFYIMKKIYIKQRKMY
jgi:hypothetical protein